MSTVSADFILGPSFPRAPKMCKDVSTKFFSCFSATDKSGPDDIEAGKIGLAKCLKEKKAYDACLSKYEKSKPESLYRVSFISFHVLMRPSYILITY